MYTRSPSPISALIGASKKIVSDESHVGPVIVARIWRSEVSGREAATDVEDFEFDPEPLERREHGREGRNRLGPRRRVGALRADVERQARGSQPLLTGGTQYADRSRERCTELR